MAPVGERTRQQVLDRETSGSTPRGSLHLGDPQCSAVVLRLTFPVVEGLLFPRNPGTGADDVQRRGFGNDIEVEAERVPHGQRLGWVAGRLGTRQVGIEPGEWARGADVEG